MKKKSFLQNFHTLPALCRTFGAGECKKAENRWKWGGGSDTMRVIIRNNLSGIASQCHLSYRGEALAFRKAFSLRQRLPYKGSCRATARLRGWDVQQPVFVSRYNFCSSSALKLSVSGLYGVALFNTITKGLPDFLRVFTISSSAST